MIVDWQHHASPEEIYKRRGGQAGQSGQPVVKDGKVGRHLRDEVYRADKHLEFMDAAGIDVSVLSAWALESVEECRLVKDFFVKLMKVHPKRFVGLAPCLPMLGEEALDELERAIDLGLKGVGISAQNNGEPLDSAKLWPFYEKVSSLGVPIFVHVAGDWGYDALDAPYNLNVTITREFDLAAATVRLVLGGVLVEFPDLKFVVAHMGGGLSSTLERLERYIDAWGAGFWTEVGGSPPFDRPYKENFRKYFDKIYFDMAGFEGGLNAVKCALTTISPQRLVFGTDYPYNFTGDPQGAKTYIENIRNLDLAPESIEGMLGGTAAALLGI